MPFQQKKTINRRFCVAPMMDWTTRHYRYMARLISQHALLYTEMVTTGALIHGDRERHLRHNTEEQPVALQLGGSQPDELALCAKMGEDAGYNEINLNIGCPSDRVQNNMIGACLMGHPELVAQCLAAMQDAVSIPVTVKHRIGIDDNDSYEALHYFVKCCQQAGINTFIVHARKAILQGLSPKENREVPPLNYDCVYQLKRDFPQAEVIINGGIKTLKECEQHLENCDGVMLGREAYHNPWLLSQVDHLFYHADKTTLNRQEVIEKLIKYTEQQLASGVYLGHITRHTLGLFHGQPGGRQFRRFLSENAYKKGATTEVLRQAADLVKHPHQSTL